MSLEEAEARMIAPPSEDELKEKSERRKGSTKASKLRKHVQAVQVSESDEAGFTMPLTIAEAKELAISPRLQAKSKSALLYEIMAKHDYPHLHTTTLLIHPYDLHLLSLETGYLVGLCQVKSS